MINFDEIFEEKTHQFFLKIQNCNFALYICTTYFMRNFPETGEQVINTKKNRRLVSADYFSWY